MSKEKLDENMGYVDLQPINKIEAREEANWETKYKSFLAEQAKVDKEVEETQAHNFDYADKKNIDNLNGQEFMNGVYFEAKQSPDKTLEEIKSIVAKNLAKNELHYVENGQFGEDGVGYEQLKSEQVSGKHAASGYSDKLKKMVKESLMGGEVVTTGNPMSYASQQAAVINQMMNEMEGEELEDDITFEEANTYAEEEVPLEPVAEDDFTEDARTDAEEEGYLDGMRDEKDDMEAALEEEKEKDTVKDKNGKAKKESVQQTLSRIDRVGTGVALEAKINAIDEEINARTEQLAMLDENEAMAQLMDKGKIKELRKEMKLLEKQKAKYDKMYEKATGNKRKEVMDETEI